jgi:hypothetical protein
MFHKGPYLRQFEAPGILAEDPPGTVAGRFQYCSGKRNVVARILQFLPTVSKIARVAPLTGRERGGLNSRSRGTTDADRSNPNPLDLVQADLIAAPVVEPGGAR